jgi:hypothetical protein
MLIFGDRYDPTTIENELQQIKPLPATTESILKDPYPAGSLLKVMGR